MFHRLMFEKSKILGIFIAMYNNKNISFSKISHQLLCLPAHSLKVSIQHSSADDKIGYVVCSKLMEHEKIIFSILARKFVSYYYYNRCGITIVWEFPFPCNHCHPVFNFLWDYTRNH